NIEAKENYGWTPLHFAAYYDNVQLELAALLVEKGADIEAKTDRDWGDYKKGSIPLDIANVSGKREIADLLSEKKAQGNSGWSPLHYAAKHGKKGLAIFMVENGANIDAKDKDGKTPLDIAVDQKHDDVVEYLKKIKEEREKPAQRKRRHHHGDHPRYYDRSSRKLLATDLSNQPEIAASSGARPSSWINDLFSWAKDSVGGLFSFRAALPRKPESSTMQSLPSVSQHNETAKDNTLSKRYQALKSQGVNFIPSTQTAVNFARRKFDSFVEDKIRNLNSKEKARIRAEVKNAYPEIIESFRRGVEFSGNIGLDDVLEKCKRCFCTNILPNNVSQSESQMLGKTDDKPETRLSNVTVNNQQITGHTK
ncbi:uncharacterized protein TNCT_13611, partial [Trichonephila clavata]